jgi:hypothetical protein
MTLFFTVFSASPCQVLPFVSFLFPLLTYSLLFFSFFLALSYTVLPLPPPPHPIMSLFFSAFFLLLPVRFYLLSLFCSLFSLTPYSFSLFSSRYLPLSCFLSSQLKPLLHKSLFFAIFSASPFHVLPLVLSLHSSCSLSISLLSNYPLALLCFLFSPLLYSLSSYFPRTFFLPSVLLLSIVFSHLFSSLPFRTPFISVPSKNFFCHLPFCFFFHLFYCCYIFSTFPNKLFFRFFLVLTNFQL